MNEDDKRLVAAISYLRRALDNHSAMRGDEVELAIALDNIRARFEMTIDRLARWENDGI